MKILIAPDSFKGSMRAVEICNAFTKRLSTTSLEYKTVPLADGGEGSLEAILHASSFKVIELTVSSPDFSLTESYYLYDTDMNVAYIELAEASGLEKADLTKINCMDTTTLGTGELIVDAIHRGAEKIILFIGGSATNDGAMGIASALGIRFLDKKGGNLKPIGRNLRKIALIDDSLCVRTDDIEFIVATDVSNPFYGPKGAAHVYAKQKGANEEEIVWLDNGLKNLNRCIGEKYNLDLQLLPGAGAAGGVGGGMAAFVGADLEAGAKLVFEATQLEQHMRWADVLITGEGKADEQSLYGKLVGETLKLAKEYNTKPILLCGFFDGDQSLKDRLGIDTVFALAPTKEDIPDAIANVNAKMKTTISEVIKQLEQEENSPEVQKQ